MTTRTRDARQVLATLANDDLRNMYAEVVLGATTIGSTLPAAKRDKLVASLVNSGLVTRDDEGGLTATAEVFRSLLADFPAKPVATGIDRFVRDGRIIQYPASPADRAEVLEWVASRALTSGESVSERDMNERLAAFSDDYAALRRYLVDAGLVNRSLTGENYERSGGIPSD